MTIEILLGEWKAHHVVPQSYQVHPARPPVICCRYFNTNIVLRSRESGLHSCKNTHRPLSRILPPRLVLKTSSVIKVGREANHPARSVGSTFVTLGRSHQVPQWSPTNTQHVQPVSVSHSASRLYPSRRSLWEVLPSFEWCMFQ